MSDPIKPTRSTATALPSTTTDATPEKTTTDGIVADGEDHNPVKDTDATGSDPE